MCLWTVCSWQILPYISPHELGRANAQRELPCKEVNFWAQVCKHSASENLQSYIPKMQLLSLIHTHHVKLRVTVTWVKNNHLQHSHTPNLALFLIWLANLQGHKIRDLHTSQPAFFKKLKLHEWFCVGVCRWRTHPITLLLHNCSSYNVLSPFSIPHQA